MRTLLLVMGLLVFSSSAFSQSEPCCGSRQSGRMDAEHRSDMELFHFLLDHRSEIRRTVEPLEDGVETVTESDDPEVAKKIRAHVESMYRRVEEKRPIHQRDPLFAEIFRHTEAIVMTRTATDSGIRVRETSTDPYVAKLIKAHAEVVTRFIENGRSEMHQNHPVPER